MGLNFNLMVGGEAGQGVQSIGFILAKAFTRGGFHVFADQDYESRVRGGHNFFRVRISNSKLEAISESVDILLALNQESVDLHRGRLAREGMMVFDQGRVKDISGDNFFAVPMADLAEEKVGNKLMANTVALGVVLRLVGYDFKIAADVLREQFGAVGAGEDNVRAAAAGYEYATSNLKGSLGWSLNPIDSRKRMLINGNEAIALGAVAAGARSWLPTL